MKAPITKYKKPLLAGGGLIVLLGAYFFRDKWLHLVIKPKQKASTSNSSTASTTQSTKSTVLKRGSKGEQVKQLQVLLNDHHRNNPPQFMLYLKVDGVFGAKTEAMLKKWTGKTSITIDQLIQDLK